MVVFFGCVCVCACVVLFWVNTWANRWALKVAWLDWLADSWPADFPPDWT